MVSRPDTKKARARRHKRVRGKVSGTASCPRLCVFRSTNNIYAQIIDDVAGGRIRQRRQHLSRPCERIGRRRSRGRPQFLRNRRNNFG